MPKVHRVTDKRACGATTVGMGLNTKVFCDNLLAAVEGDQVSDHIFTTTPGALIHTGSGKVKVQGQNLITALMDNASPDAPNPLLQHVTGLPTPAQGSNKVTAYGAAGSFGGGIGSFGMSGMPGVGEIMQIGSQVMGQVSRAANQGSGQGVLVMNNMTSQSGIGPGSTVTSANTGRTFTFSEYYSS